MRSVAVLGLGLAVPLAPVAGQQLTATERAEAVATIWAEARYNFASWDRVRADWDSALAANLKLAAQVQSDVLFYRRLRRLVALLGDGQAGVIPPAHLRSRIARPPLLLQSVEQRPLILEYAENDEMRVARPERLAEILAVQGVPAESCISVTRSVSLNDRWPLERPELEIDSLPGGVVRVRLNALAEEDVVRRFDRAFPDFAGLTGLILDLRYAASGESRYGYEILARLTARAFPAARWRTPQYRPVFRAWRVPDSAFSWYGPPPDTVSPRTERPGYTGPVAVLASSATAGAAEDLLVAFRNAARGVIIGETSAGSPGEALTIALPKNWAIQLSVTRHAFPNGEEFAGRGIRPELPVASTVADVLAGTDAVLARAREYVSGKQR